jgi:hypothetical protein
MRVVRQENRKADPPPPAKDDKVWLWNLAERVWKGVGGEVFPGSVGGFDECDFFFAREVFQIFLAGYGVVDVLEAFVIDQAVNFVFCCEGVCDSFAMFADSAAKIIRDTDIKSSRAAGEDVDVILMVWRHRCRVIGEKERGNGKDKSNDRSRSSACGEG